MDSEVVFMTYRSYRPSQPHGWPAVIAGQSVGVTIGGHVTSRDFTHGGRSYRIRLVPFGGSDTDAVSENFPTDSTIDFKAILAESYGAHYSFRYLGGVKQRKFAVQSYSVYVNEPTDASPLNYGADLYVVCEPDIHPGDPSVRATFRWIQVARSQDVAGSPKNFVDSKGRANPFYAAGGITSIYGRRVLNFAYGASVSPTGPDGDAVVSDEFVAEAFLVQDTGIQDKAGKEIIHVFGGIKYGWQVCEVNHA
jgi:hypothetical protein